MDYTGTTRGNHIELDQSLPLPDGTRVRVEVERDEGLRRGSPAAVLRLAGTLSDEEADAILEAARGCRRIDAELWDPRS